MLEAIATCLPTRILANEELAQLYPEWPAEKIYAKTGIRSRRVAAENETASDLAFQSAEALLEKRDRSAIDFLLFCTQAPDYILPSSACVMQHRLQLPDRTGALDFHLGCSGYIYGLALSQSLINAGLASNTLLLAADTYSKFIHPKDKSARTIFGDAGTATLLSANSRHRLHSFVFGTDGSGAERLIVKGGGTRFPKGSYSEVELEDASGNTRTEAHLAMDGPEVFNFTLARVPPLVESVLAKAQVSLDSIDLFVFHQANAFMLESLRRKMKLPEAKFVVCLEDFGNTVSATIPLTLHELKKAGRLAKPARILLAGFGVGFSWAGCILEWKG